MCAKEVCACGVSDVASTDSLTYPIHTGNFSSLYLFFNLPIICFNPCVPMRNQAASQPNWPTVEVCEVLEVKRIVIWKELNLNRIES